MKKKILSVILVTMMALNFGVTAMAGTACEGEVCGTVEPRGVGLNLTCPQCKDALGVIKGQFYDINSGCLVYQIECPSCEFYWEIWEPAAGFRTVPEKDEVR